MSPGSHSPDLVVFPLVPRKPLLLFLEGPNKTWTPLAGQFPWRWALVSGPQMLHYPNATLGLNDPGIQVLLAEFRRVLGPHLQRPGDTGATPKACTKPLEEGQTCRQRVNGTY